MNIAEVSEAYISKYVATTVHYRIISNIGAAK